MRFVLEPEHKELGASIDSMLAKSDLPAVVRAWGAGDTEPGRKVWARLAETGVNGLVIDEDHGGFGAGAVEMIVAVEQLGRHCVPGPVAETVAAAPALLAAAGLTDRLESLAEGQLATLAWAPHVPFAVDAGVADLTLLVDADGALAVGEPGAAKQSVDPARSLFPLTAGASLATGVDTTRAFDLAALATAAQLQGLGQTMLSISTEYAKARKQFGREIGSFQAIKHHLAEVAIALEMARPLLLGAALAVDGVSDVERAADVSRDVSAAKIACGAAANRAARTALQVMGAIGYTQEHDLSLYLTRTRALLTSWGTPAVHRARVLAAVSAAEPA
ncbi:acyl-CoA dehydrogenase [Rhodococcus sp. X156]|uniref:acyl-CoA dehydrogenase n=1 Tax=Rhodococcus sp. X156 TaxID=2499145 RepID=UPI000FDBEE24|nr:acyl-CoA dehydrogenase [Rhodococcus sp. X156]